MAGSKKRESTPPRHLREQLVAAARTPGSLGINDAGDPTRFSLLGDTPGPLGSNDHGSPRRLTVPGLRTFNAWLDEAAVHVAPEMQAAHYYPAASKQEVFAKASEFIARWESVERRPYVPGVNSGITIGVGYDLRHVSEAEFRRDWAELAHLRSKPEPFSLGVAPGRPATGQPSLLGVGQLSMEVAKELGPVGTSSPKMFPFDSPLFTALDRLAFAISRRLSHEESLQYVEELEDISIPQELSMRVFEQCSLPKYYDQMSRAMPGVSDLPRSAGRAPVARLQPGTVDGARKRREEIR
jgi:hypothetical protein